MADYAVGGISFEFSVKDGNKVTTELNKIADSLTKVKNAISSFGRLNERVFQNFTKNINDLARADFEGVANNFAKIGSEDVSENINKVASSFDKLTKSVSGIAGVEIDKFSGNIKDVSKVDLGSLVESFEKLNQLDPKVLTALTSAIRNIKKLGEDGIDFDKIKAHFYKLADAVEPFLQKLEQVKPELQAFSNALDLGRVNSELISAELKLKKIEEINQKIKFHETFDDLKIKKANVQLEKANLSLENMKNKADKTHKSFSQLFTIGKIYFFLNYFKRIGQAIGKAISLSIDFEETLNKFSVSFGSLTTQATDFVNKMTRSFNLSSESIMNYMSTFNNMLKGLGQISDETSLRLSENLTQMAVDYASLMNTSIETAMQQFQSVLAGQTKAIRTTSGVDVTDNTIYQMYQELGGTKTVKQLTQTEKRLLRILAVQKQLQSLGTFGVDEKTGKTIGDFERTIKNTGNLVKQIAETFKEWGVYLGNILKFRIYPILEKVLTLGIVLKEITKAYSDKMGFSAKQSNLGLIGTQAEETTKQLEEMQKTMGLLSFDRFESLGKSSDSETDDIETILKGMQDYKDPFANVENEARETAKWWLQLLGYTAQVTKKTDEYENEIEEINYAFDQTKENTLSIVNILTNLSNLIKIITDFVKDMKDVFNGVGETIKGIINAIKIVLSPVVKGVLSIIQTILGVISDILGVTENEIFSISDVLVPVLTFVAKLGSYLLATATQILYLVEAIIRTITKIFSFKWGQIGDVWEDFADNSRGLWSNLQPLFSSNKPLKNLTSGYASGGFPTKGQMFIANEKGAELVGNIGGRTAVANNDMIVSAIEQASYRGIVRGMSATSNRQDINIDLRGFNADEVARAIYTPLLKEFKRNGVNIQGA